MEGFGRRPELFVVDPTSDTTRMNASKAAVDRFHRQSKIKVKYFSSREMGVFLTRASKFSWIDSDALRYALTGDQQVGANYGAACNVAMLLAGKRKALIVSAGTRHDVVGAPGGKNCFRIHPARAAGFGPLHGDAEALTFFGSIDDAASKLHRTSEVDLLGEVDRVLGHCQTSCGSSFSTSHGHGRDEGIGAVSLGTWGDVGLDSSNFYMLSRNAASLGASDSSYAGRLNRIVHRSSVDWVTGVSKNFRPVAFGLCPSTHRVPFLPTESVRGGFAGQSLFGTLLNRQASCQVAMAIPMAVKNCPGGAQAFSSDDVVESVRRISFTDFLGIMIGKMESARCLDEIGHGLVSAAHDLSFLAPTTQSWGSYVADSVAIRKSYGVELADMMADLDLIADAGARILENSHRRGHGKGQVFDDYLAPYEFRTGALAGHTGSILIRQLVQFGRLLVAWPGLVAAMADLDKNGVRLGAYA